MRCLLIAVATLLCAACNCGSEAQNDAGSGGGTGGSSGQGAGGGSAVTGGGAAVTGGGAGVTGGGTASPFDAGTPPNYSCAAFTSPAGWVVSSGFRAVQMAGPDAGLNQPVAMIFAGAAYNWAVYVVNQGNNSITRFSPDFTTASTFSTTVTGRAPMLMTTLTWDSQNQFDGQIYVSDQGSDSDGDSVVYRLAPSGALTAFAQGPGPGLDDIFGMAFTPSQPGWPRGLLVAGDTDGAATSDWGLIDADGGVTGFTRIPGIEGMCVDPTLRYGAALLASSPASGGYAGNDSIIRVLPDGGSDGTITSGISGVHAVMMAPDGPFSGEAYAASWSSQRIFSVTADGGTRTIASGLSLTNYDGNILAFSPDGRVLLVADRQANRIVCIEQVP